MRPSATPRDPLRRSAWPIVLLVLFLGLAFGLMSIPHLARDRVPIVSPETPVPFRVDLDGGVVAGEIEVAEDGRFRVAGRLSGVGGGAASARALSLVLLMPEHAMEPLVPSLWRSGGADFVASGVLPMPGLWELRLRTPAGQAAIAFRVEE